MLVFISDKYIIEQKEELSCLLETNVTFASLQECFESRLEDKCRYVTPCRKYQLQQPPPLCHFVWYLDHEVCLNLFLLREEYVFCSSV